MWKRKSENAKSSITNRLSVMVHTKIFRRSRSESLSPVFLANNSADE